MDKSVVFVVLVAVLMKQCSGQNWLGAYNKCMQEYKVDPVKLFKAIRDGDFSVRTPMIECVAECVVKRAGFMNDDLSFNNDTIVKFMSRFITREDSEAIYNTCIQQDVTLAQCTTAFEVYQCVYEKGRSKWDEARM